MLIYLASFFDSKARLWLNGRRNIFQKINESLVDKHEKNIVWFHCASLGEFEQGRPLIERIKNENPHISIFLTFFSPSGFEAKKHYGGADHIFYLPLDTRGNARAFVEMINPTAVFFVKYEFWYNYLLELKKRKIPTYLVSAVFRPEQYFFKFYGAWFRKQLNAFSHIFLQSESSEKLLNGIGFYNTSVAGDTRFDRVYEISKAVKALPLIEKFKKGREVLVAGSTWLEDEKILKTLDWNRTTYKLILAPHEIEEKHLLSIEDLFLNKKVVRYSKANELNLTDADILLIDNIGMLSSLYQYGTIAYVGGGFGEGIHNILEAATFGIPIVFGPNYHKFIEAKELIKLKGAFCVRSKKEIYDLLQSFNTYENKDIERAGHVTKTYVNSHIGASDKILNSIKLS